MTKISKQEFENYAELVKNFFLSIPANSKEEKEIAVKMTRIYWSSLRKQNPLVLMIAIENVEIFSKLDSEDNFANVKIPELGNLTIQQFLENLREKLKKHYQAKGNLQSSNSSLEEKYEKTRQYMRKKNEQNFKAISPYLEEETYKELLEYFSFQDKNEKIFEEYNIEQDDDEISKKNKEIMIKKYPFVIENLAANFLEAERKKSEQENYSKGRNSTDNSTTNQPSFSQPNQNNPSSENSSSSEDKDKIDKLEREKSQLESQIKELQNKLSNANLSPEKIKDYENQLSQSLKDVRNKTQQIQQTKSETKPESQEVSQNSTAASSFDWKWAVGIGLGVFIVLLLLILIVVNISRQKKE